eukprot:CAMPEP_0114652768 /NCGR_PEP_ID=MMETSP0191-20121206/9260_1 /TAXON_ID=126664 /ORGANISM="Sorites sp." /LENGTH=49 /DNA_ID= /DNA_START= /DNA_END= /DNA_ORIENTATION=
MSERTKVGEPTGSCDSTNRVQQITSKSTVQLSCFSPSAEPPPALVMKMA